MTRVFITGITGFVGSHLAEYVLNNNLGEVFGLARWRSPREHLVNCDMAKLIEGDLLDTSSLLRALKLSKPDIIFHLAAQSFVPASFQRPLETFQVNANGTINLLEAVRIYADQEKDFDPIFLMCSSSEVYGRVERENVPINENAPLKPLSPYAVSKVAADMACYSYFKTFGVQTIRTRAFTHSGPRRANCFCDSHFAWQIAQIERGKQTCPIQVGNLGSVRTFCDVRDMVRAYWLVANEGEIGEVYNIGGNETMTIGEMLTLLKKISRHPGLGHEIAPDLLRPADVTLQIPDCTKFKNATSWEPAIPYSQTLKDMLDYWRAKV